MYDDATCRLSMNGENSDSMLHNFFWEMCVLNEVLIHKPSRARTALHVMRIILNQYVVIFDQFNTY